MKRYTYSDEVRASLEELQQPLAVYQYLDGRIVAILVSDGFCRLFGFADHEHAVWNINHDIYKEIHPDDRKRISSAALRSMLQGEKFDAIYRTKAGTDSDYRVIHARGKVVYVEDGIQLAHVWYMDEGLYIEGEESAGTQINRALNSVLHEESILKAVNYDALTDLPNLAYFFKLCEIGKARVFHEGQQGCLLYMDLNGMKYYNYRNGFAEGDKLLKSFADIMKSAFGIENCCHIGADRFAASAIEEGLEEKLQSFFDEVEKMEKYLPVRIGIYSTSLEDVPISTAYDRAKVACDAISKTGSCAFRFYTQDMSDREKIRHYIRTNLDKAISEKWIRVYLQPIIRAVNEQVCDVEALARWIDPEKGFLSPAEFIPALEDSGLVYKLDLYMVDQVLEMMKMYDACGMFIFPHSINLSRSDFDACDIVEEIRERVDKAGVRRDRITIEITESMIGSDFEYMKKQVDRFRQLGFAVWMDDFGSGYSSLDVLQSIQFDLVKFDMGFLRKLDEGNSGKVILTELVKLVTELGIDTVCEGVETEKQVRFLQEIGCSKLQGFYYSKPVSGEDLMQMHKDHTLLAHENPDEVSYYESLGRVNLYDLGVIANSDENALQKYFDMLPIAVIETYGDKARYVRCSRSYQTFVNRLFHINELKDELDFSANEPEFSPALVAAIKECSSNANRVFIDDIMPDGLVTHYFIRKVDTNPVTGRIAIAIAVLSVKEPDENTTYADIARALAADYYNIFVIDLDSNDFTEYSSQTGGEELSVVRQGEDFFESARRDTMTRIYEEDREPFLALFTRDRVLQDLDSQGVFTATYRLIDTGEPVYVNMKITRMHGGNRIILGISVVDAHMKQREERKKLQQEKVVLGRIAALSPNYIALYAADLETGAYLQYNQSKEFADIGLAKKGVNFFHDVIEDAPKAIFVDDMERHLRVFTKENVMREIKENGVFIHNYRLVLRGKTVPVNLRAAEVEESDGNKLIVGVMIDDREEHRRKLEEAYEKARDDSIIATHIAQAMARGCTDLYYVNMDTDELIEFHTEDDLGVFTEARRSADFFEGCERDVKIFVHPDDQKKFVEVMNRNYLDRILNQSNVFEFTYRRKKENRFVYVQMRISRVEEDKRYIVIAVSDIDELMKKRFAEERIREERIIYARLHALTGNFIVVYVVDPGTGNYREFRATDDYREIFSQSKEGEDFFGKVRDEARIYNDPSDLDMFLSVFTKENIMEEVNQSGVFTFSYRLMMDGIPHYIQMKAAMVEEKEGPRLIVGLNDIDAQIKQEQELRRRLAQAQERSDIDALTGGKE